MERREFLMASGVGLGAASALTEAVSAAPTEPAETVAGTRYVTEPARSIPVSGAYDAVVVGGGIAGVAAAVAAARNGASVCLMEKENALGGLATLGNVVVYLPLCDGKGNKVIGGIGEELLKLSVADGFNPIPSCWAGEGTVEERTKSRYRVTFNPASFMLSMEDWLLKAGVKLMYDTRFCTVLREGRQVRSVIVENKSGRSAIMCSCVIDGSGDADVCAQAGEPTESVRTNVAAGWFYTWDRKSLRLVVNSAEFRRDPRQAPRKGNGYAGDNAEDVTAQLIETHDSIQRKLAVLQVRAKGTTLFPAILPTIPCFRMTRRLQGRVVVLEEHNHKWFDDVVGMTGDWRSAGPVYFLPLSSMTGIENDNLLAIGRCMSADGPAWDVTRVIPTCAVTGEAAGVAAAMASRDHGGDVSKVSVPALQEKLKSQGVLIDHRFAG